MPLTFHHKQLPNGLDIIAEVNPDSHSFAAGLFVKTGSRDEQADVNGVSIERVNAYLKANPAGPYTIVTVGPKELKLPG